MKVLPVQAPDWRFVDGDGHLALERRRFRLGDLHVFKVFDDNEGLSCGKDQEQSVKGNKKTSTEVKEHPTRGEMTSTRNKRSTALD